MDSVAFIVNGDIQSAMAYRARAFRNHLSRRFKIQIAYRSRQKLISIASFVSFLRQVKPRISYVFDMSVSGVIAASLYKFGRDAQKLTQAALKN